jgi:hypothetical protein
MRIRLWRRILLFSSVTFKKTHKKQLFFLLSFYAFFFLKVHLYHPSKIVSHKKSQNSRNQEFSSFFCLLMEEYRSGAGAGSGSIQISYGSRCGSRRTKNIWILWVGIRMRIRILNTGAISNSGPVFKEILLKKMPK